MAITAAAGIIAAGTAIYGGIQASKEKKRQQQAAASALANRPMYQTSPYIMAQLADAKSRLNATDPGVLAGYQQAQQAMSNRIAAGQRVASSGAEALAVGADAQGNFNAQLPSLIQSQSAYSQNAQRNYYNALNGMAEDDRMKFQDAGAANADRFNYALGQAGAASAQQGQYIGLLGSSLASAAGGLGKVKFGTSNKQYNTSGLDDAISSGNKDYGMTGGYYNPYKLW